MISMLKIDGRSTIVELPPGQRLEIQGDDFYLFEGNTKTRVALHINESNPFAHRIDTILPLDEPVRA